jgi:hypothetical protein
MSTHDSRLSAAGLVDPMGEHERRQIIAEVHKNNIRGSPGRQSSRAVHPGALRFMALEFLAQEP